MKLTEKQKRFVDEYIKSRKISASNKFAYPSIKKDSAVRASGQLSKVNLRFSEIRYKPDIKDTVQNKSFI